VIRSRFGSPRPSSPSISPVDSLLTHSVLYRCSSTGIFVATIFLSFLGCLIVLSLVWETLRKCRKRASGKGWKQLDAEKEIRKRMKEQGPEPLLRFRGPMHPPHPYDPPPRLTRQYRGPAPPPLPPVPTQYQQCAPQPYHNPLVGQLADSHGNSSRSYADTVSERRALSHRRPFVSSGRARSSLVAFFQSFQRQQRARPMANPTAPRRMTNATTVCGPKTP
jgi:hypothetical protein